jgi:hypothetical protein
VQPNSYASAQSNERTFGEQPTSLRDLLGELRDAVDTALMEGADPAEMSSAIRFVCQELTERINRVALSATSGCER